MKKLRSKYPTELWAAVKDHPNYEVSSDGQVKSLFRVLINRTGQVRVWKERLLTCRPNAKGYHSIVLDGKGVWLHKMVAVAFLPNPERKRCVNHLDGVKSHNYADNPEWATHAENMAHAMKTGLFLSVQGSNQHMAKLTEIDIPVIRWLLSIEMSHESIARRYGVSSATVYLIANGKTWKHVPE